MSAKAFETLSAVSAGVKDVREVAERARARLGERGQGTILFLDEVHRFSRAQQDVLLPFVEEGLLVLVGATTENPFFSLTGPLLSRSTLFRLEPLGDADLRELAQRALADRERGLGDEATEIDDDALEHLVDKSEGDARHLLTVLEVAHALAVERGDRPHLARGRGGRARAALGQLRRRRALRHRVGVHQVDPRLRSRRGRLLARAHARGGRGRALHRAPARDPRVGGRRPRRSAVVARRRTPRPARSSTSGCPEAALNLAHAVIHLALAPKSNSVTSALGAATAAVRDRRSGPVPMHLRDSHYRGAQSLGHGEGYVYPHDAPQGWVPQDHMPAGGRR